MLQVYCRIELPKPTLRKNNFLFLQNRDSIENLFSARIAESLRTLADSNKISNFPLVLPEFREELSENRLRTPKVIDGNHIQEPRITN